MSDTVFNALALRSFIDLRHAQDGEGFGQRLGCVPVAERHDNVTSAAGEVPRVLCHQLMIPGFDDTGTLVGQTDFSLITVAFVTCGGAVGLGTKAGDQCLVHAVASQVGVDEKHESLCFTRTREDCFDLAPSRQLPMAKGQWPPGAHGRRPALQHRHHPLIEGQSR
ncbi:hypothetical protein [Streptomyces sp. NPDC007070]|uniref:hypothetical protein n=1 Tax=Streptomyces sp. NPDC007070 TaxID=3154312 RepID=UPI0033D3AB8B